MGLVAKENTFGTHDRTRKPAFNLGVHCCEGKHRPIAWSLHFFNAGLGA